MQTINCPDWGEAYNRKMRDRRQSNQDLPRDCKIINNQINNSNYPALNILYNRKDSFDLIIKSNRIILFEDYEILQIRLWSLENIMQWFPKYYIGLTGRDYYPASENIPNK